MTALVIDGSDVRMEAREAPLETPPGEARVRMVLAGVCATDLELARGYMGFRGVPGHEFVGVVEQAGDARLVGERVVGDINCACLRCDQCMKGLEQHCPNRTVLGILGRDGAFQSTFLLPERNLRVVPRSVPDEHAVFAEPVAAACRILEQIDLLPWQRVAVLGDGKLGILCAWVLAERSHSVTVFGRHPGRVAFPVHIEERPLPEKPDRSFDVVVEATGSPDGLEQALRLVQPTGTVVLKTTCAEKHHLSLAPLVIDEVRVIGSRCGPMSRALELLASGSLPVHRLIAARYPLGDAPAALGRAAEPGVLKVLVSGSR